MFSISVAQESDQKKSSFDISKTATLTKQSMSLQHVAAFDLGTLPSGEQGTVTLKVINPTSEPFSFDRISKSCNCVDVVPERKSIPAGGATEFKLNMKTSVLARKEIMLGSVALIDDSRLKGEGPVININFRYNLAGLLCIEPTMISLEVPVSQSETELKIPFLITKPLTPDRLKFEVDESLEDLDFEIEGSGNDLIASAFVPSALLEQGPISGEVKIIDTISNRQDMVYVTLRNGTEYKISPSVLRFTQQKSDAEENPSGLHEATALLRLPDRFAEVELEKATLTAGVRDRKLKVGVSASIAGVACGISAKQIGARIVKVRVSADFSKLDTTYPLVQWKVQDGADELTMESSFVLIN